MQHNSVSTGPRIRLSSAVCESKRRSNEVPQFLPVLDEGNCMIEASVVAAAVIHKGPAVEDTQEGPVACGVQHTSQVAAALARPGLEITTAANAELHRPRVAEVFPCHGQAASKHLT